MGDGTVVTPDLDFVKSLKSSGADTVKRCYQCATCSAVCSLTPPDDPFPRREMSMAQWGLKADLAADPNIWLCHNCNECTKYCPRGARPGDVLAVLRKQAITENAFPGFLAKIVGEPKLLILTFLIPIVLFLLILNATGHLNIPDGPVVYDHFFPIHYVDPIFLTSATFVFISFVISISRFWKNLNTNPHKLMAEGNLVKSIVETLKEFLLHKKFEKCTVNKDRTWAHRFVFFGFLGLFITTNWAVFYIYVLGWHSPYRVDDPAILALFNGSKELVVLCYLAFKGFGNLSALALFIGAVLIFNNKAKDKGFVTKMSAFDSSFNVVVMLLFITGILSELLRWGNVANIAYPMYFAHLVFVFYTIAFLPFTKLAHMVYRTTAIVYAKMANKD
ncbi:MAG: quinone-interacting membrane-bound oxidoreductase complex subunit QmoC [Nitrospirae bacterium]|nr:quinone-interacting membrane-bound oxidoreductase complex subunit QmoC [Nitrospirota bacterium]